MMTVLTITMIIPLGLVVAKAHGGSPALSSFPPQIISSLDFNSSEDFKMKSVTATRLIDVGREILHKVKEIATSNFGETNKVELGKSSSSNTSGKKIGSMSSDIPNVSKRNRKILNDSNHASVTYGFHLVKGETMHPMEGYVFAQTKKIVEQKVGLFAIYDGYMSHKIPEYLLSHLLNNMIAEPDFLLVTANAVREAYRVTDTNILCKSKPVDLGNTLGGASAVTAVIVNDHGLSKLVVANVGNSRAVICCKNHLAKQLSVDHVPSIEMERQAIEKRGGMVTQMGLVNGLLPISRAFGVSTLKKYISCEPNVVVEMIDDEAEFLVLASHSLWAVMSNQQVVDSIRQIQSA